jgi:hypothetical protein
VWSRSQLKETITSPGFTRATQPCSTCSTFFGSIVTFWTDRVPACRRHDEGPFREGSQNSPSRVGHAGSVACPGAVGDGGLLAALMRSAAPSEAHRGARNLRHRSSTATSAASADSRGRPGQPPKSRHGSERRGSCTARSRRSWLSRTSRGRRLEIHRTRPRHSAPLMLAGVFRLKTLNCSVFRVDG